MLDAPHLPEQAVFEGREGHQLRHVVGTGWLLGIPLMFGISVLVVWVATRSMVWTLVVAAWGAVVAGPYFGGFAMLNRGELGADHEADLEVLPVRLPPAAQPPAA
jgi:hypothetical protein